MMENAPAHSSVTFMLHTKSKDSVTVDVLIMKGTGKPKEEVAHEENKYDKDGGAGGVCAGGC
jgi:hypothetical protein